MPRYRVTVVYETETTKKISEWMQSIMPHWKSGDRRLMIGRPFEFEVDEPLTPELIQKIKDNLPRWATKVEIEEVT